MTDLVCHAHIVSRVLCILHLKSQIGQTRITDGNTKAKAREQNDSLIDFNEPKPQTNIDQTTDIDKVAFSKLQIRQSDPKEEPIEVTNSLIPPPPPVTEIPGDMTGNTNGEELSEAEKRLQKEEEKYDLYGRVYVGQLSKEEESDMQTQTA